MTIRSHVRSVENVRIVVTAVVAQEMTSVQVMTVIIALAVMTIRNLVQSVENVRIAVTAAV
jgi:hypothetical protein